MRAGLLTFEPAEEGESLPDEPTSSLPATFTMTKDGDTWLFATTDYLEPFIESLQEEKAAAEKDK